MYHYQAFCHHQHGLLLNYIQPEYLSFLFLLKLSLSAAKLVISTFHIITVSCQIYLFSESTLVHILYIFNITVNISYHQCYCRLSYISFHIFQYYRHYQPSNLLLAKVLFVYTFHSFHCHCHYQLSKILLLARVLLLYIYVYSTQHRSSLLPESYGKTLLQL